MLNDPWWSRGHRVVLVLTPWSKPQGQQRLEWWAGLRNYGNDFRVSFEHDLLTDHRAHLPKSSIMPSTTPSKRRKATRLLTSPVAKISVTLFNALTPLLLLRLTWTALLQDPTSTLITSLLTSIFIIQTTFIVLLLPLLTSTKPSKKRGIVKIDTIGEAMRSKAIVPVSYRATLTS